MRTAGVIAFVVLIAIASSVKATEDELQLANEQEDGQEFTLDETPATPAEQAPKPPAVPATTKRIVAHEKAIKKAKAKAAASQSKADRLHSMIKRRAALRKRLKQLRKMRRKKRSANKKLDPALRRMMDETMRRMAAAAQVTLPEGEPVKTGGDRHVQSLEKKLAYFEESYRENTDKRRKSEMKAIDERINKLHKAVSRLAKNAKAQAVVTQKLIVDERRRDPLNTVIGEPPKYDPSQALPKSFEKEVAHIISSVKRDAGKIYRKNCGKNRPFCRVVRKSLNPKPAPKTANKPADAPATPAKKPVAQNYVDSGAAQ